MNRAGVGAGYEMGIACCGCPAQSDLYFGYRFQHKNPEDPAEVPGGFLSDLNPVGSWGMG